MRKYIRNILFSMIVIGIVIGTNPSPTVHAWGDNGGGRESYTVEEINNGAIGDTDPNSENYPGTIVFNSISDSVIGDEKNFVAARECFQNPDGTWIGATKDTIWEDSEITVENGRTYIIRLYVHNNNPNAFDAVAENTKVKFIIPITSAKEIEVNGIISSSTATPDRYWDHVTFKSSNPFHLEYIENTALLENNGIGSGGVQLSNDVIQDSGTLIGYDKLDGRVPGCYQYANYVSIKVKVVFDYDFMVETKVRHAGDKEWHDTIDAEVGDKVEFQIQYRNTSDEKQTHVVMRDLLPPSLRYVPGSTKIMDAAYPNGATVNEDVIIDDEGMLLGDYTAGSNAFIMFTAEVIEDGLACGKNNLINKGQVYVNSKLIEDRAYVTTKKEIEDDNISNQPALTIVIIALLGCIAIIVRLIIKIIRLNMRKINL